MSVPFFLLERPWSEMQGLAYGQRDAAILCKAALAPGVQACLPALDQAMAVWLPDAVLDPLTGAPGEAAFATRVLQWVAAVMRHGGVPVFRAGHARLMEQAETRAVTVLLAVPSRDARSTMATLTWALKACVLVFSGVATGATPTPLPAWDGLRGELERLVADLRQLAPRGVNTYRFLEAADALDLPVRRLSGEAYCLGTGRHSRWLESSFTDRTSALGATLAQDKMRTAQVLRQEGLPVPVHAPAASAQEAVQIARKLGFPVVVKPANLAQGSGVATNLRCDADVQEAFEAARKLSQHVLVEKHVHGNDYRLTVLHGKVVKAIIRRPGGVVGDGVQTVSELVLENNRQAQHARRARERGRVLLTLDSEALAMLAQAGLAPQAVPARGQYVCLRGRANVSAGGTPMLLDQPAHPDNLRLAERAAAALNLDLAGVDILMEDISRSWLDTAAVICEVNARPQIGAGTTPAVYAEILRGLFPGGVRMPVVLVVGQPRAGGPHDMLVGLWKQAGLCVGWSAGQGVWRDGERLAGAQARPFEAGRIVMAQRDIDAAVLVMTPAEILRCGLPFDRCDAVILDNPDKSAPGGAPEVAEMLRMLAPHVRQHWVVQAGDPVLLAHERALRATGRLSLVAVGDAGGAGLALAKAAEQALGLAAAPALSVGGVASPGAGSGSLA